MAETDFMSEKRAEILKGLKCCSYLEHPNCGECPQDGPGFGFACRDDLLKWARVFLEMQDWISVEERMPPERDTIFAPLYGTDKWRNAMFRKMSDDVRVVCVFEDGSRKVWHDHTVDGKWSCELPGKRPIRHITHWMENPALPEKP